MTARPARTSVVVRPVTVSLRTAPPRLPARFAFDGVLFDGADADRPTCMGLPATPGGVGTDGDDVLTGTPGKDVIVAGVGNDVIHGHHGKDTICGGPGDDTLVGRRNPADWSNAEHGDRLSGGSGEDRIVDNWGFRDKILGGSGDDRIRSRHGMEKEFDGGYGAEATTCSTGVKVTTLLKVARGPTPASTSSRWRSASSRAPGPQPRDAAPLGI